jgi:predicted transposase YbfD/YdcC
MLTKENAEIKMNLLENEKYLEKKENQELIKEKIRKNNSEHKLRIIQDLQNKIQRYKIRRGNNLNNYNFEDQ